ncbi:alpha-ketoglutarate-dependent dioxygenase alkB homolog 3-like [Patiria miniata]|uniref:Fe2OG dioxygenase domain-containing protein n=1 Tax=Patiria miniata TaxID=46514 RepID=A0A913ZBD2_PATMI|nr:alpha-ketoglutarate-dependent dioxygenase alkB homolog 3-like [Patiria miniata]XP_038049092.1 alpha-ketoglutarate-dependent dioxygenase alkB homolog 3-like [Patiria miniata]XP_038049093.1 alpha-ketoglutarate-dependent dioxygenase alkB homolog 3-like [Patiria miniata]
MAAHPQEARRAPYPSSQNGRTQSRGGGNRQKSRIQGGWAADAHQPRGRVQARGRGQPNFRGRGYHPTLQCNLGPDPTQEPPSDPNPQAQEYPPGLNPYAPEFKSAGGPPKQEQSQDMPYPEHTVTPHQGYFGQPHDLMHQGYKYIPPAPEEQVSVPEETKPKMIEEDGEYIISEEPSGKSRIVLFKNFLSQEEADEALCQLEQEIKFKQQVNKNRAGKDYLEPRLVRWFGEHPYAYSKVRMEANEEWPPALLRLKEKIEKKNDLTFNSVLANLYRTGKDGVAWHSDDEYGLREQPKIASLSLGETRMFEMRKKPPKGINPYEFDYTTSEKLTVPLTHGALLLMTDHTQDDWQHQVPKEYHDKQKRINLTFRTIYPDARHERKQDRVLKLD